MTTQELHNRAIEAAQRYFRAEAILLDVLQLIDSRKAFRELGHTSLFSYAVGELKFSESMASNFINVARKSVTVPALKAAIRSGTLGVSKARKIVPVLTIQNQSEWIDKAKTLSSRELEREVARVAPIAANSGGFYYINGSRVRVSVDLAETIWRKIKRVQDLESQKQKRSVTMEETLEGMSSFYLEKNDPVEKAKRFIKSRSKKSPVTGHVTAASDASGRLGLQKRLPVEAALARAIVLRDEGRCTARTYDGSRCNERRWLHVHHIIPVSKGGLNSMDNLVTLCSAHHQMHHDKHSSSSGPKSIEPQSQV